MADSLIADWKKRGSYHFSSLVPATFKNHKVVMTFAELGEGIFLNTSCLPEGRLSACVQEVLEKGLRELHANELLEDPPALIHEGARVFTQYTPTLSSTPWIPIEGPPEIQLMTDLQWLLTDMAWSRPHSNVSALQRPHDPYFWSIPASSGLAELHEQAAAISAHTTDDAAHVPGNSSDELQVHDNKSKVSIVHTGDAVAQQAWCKYELDPTAQCPDTSRERAESVDFYVSHAVRDSWRHKRNMFLNFAFLYEYYGVVLAGSFASVAVVFPFVWGVAELLGGTAWGPFMLCLCVVTGSITVLLLSWPSAALWFPPCFAPWNVFGTGTTFWLEGLCEEIWSDSNARVQGRLKQLRASNQLLVLFSSDTLSELWPVFELAMFSRWHKDENRLEDFIHMLGLDWDIFTSDLQQSEEDRLLDFSCRQAWCWNPEDRAVLLNTIRDEWGTEQAFDEYVQQELPQIALKCKQRFAVLPFKAAEGIFEIMLGN